MDDTINSIDTSVDWDEEVRQAVLELEEMEASGTFDSGIDSNSNNIIDESSENEDLGNSRLEPPKAREKQVPNNQKQVAKRNLTYYKCGRSSCKYFAYDSRIVSEHFQSQHMDKPFKTDLDKHNRYAISKLKKRAIVGKRDNHKKAASRGIMYYKCSVLSCKYFAYDPAVVIQHYQTEHIDTNMLKNNRRIHYQCNFCDYCPIRKSDLQKHLKSVHKSDPDSYQLEIKSQAVEDASSSRKIVNIILSHIKKTITLKTFDCDICDGKFIEKSLLLVHQVCFHLKVKVSKCLLCPFYDPSAVERFGENPFIISKHIMDVHKPKPQYQYCYSCKLCPFTSPATEKVENHLLYQHFQETHQNYYSPKLKSTSKCSRIQDRNRKSYRSKNCSQPRIKKKRGTPKQKPFEVEDENQEMTAYELIRHRNIQERAALFKTLQL